MNARRRTANRRGFPDNLYQKADGYFWYRNPETGKTKGLGHDRAYAFREARNANAVLAQKEPSSLVDWVLGGDAKTLAEWMTEYEAIYISSRSPAATTLAMLRSQMRSINTEEFASKQLRAITTMDISKFIEKVEKDKGPRAGQQRRSALLDIFREAEARGHIESGKNPVAVVRNPKVVVQRDRLSLEQFLAIREQASGWIVNAMNMALLSGQRREDVAEAEFKDFRDGYWYLVQGKTKTKLRIPLTLRINAIGLSLEDVVKQCRDDVVSKYLIHHTTGNTARSVGRKVDLSAISNQFADARQRAGITTTDGRTPPTFHEIRSLSERLYEKEYGSGFTQKLLGHKSPKMTAVYHDVRGSDWIDVAVG